jgi:hypothetical protein
VLRAPAADSTAVPLARFDVPVSIFITSLLAMALVELYWSLRETKLERYKIRKVAERHTKGISMVPTLWKAKSALRE